nr:hypothetical protein [uncultured Draconibacterium sp.]
MEIIYLNHNEINKTKWDQCICHSKNRLVYALSWYLDIVNPGWDAIIVDDYETVLPITHAKKFGINYLYQPYFTQQLGIFSIHDQNQQLIEKLLSKIPDKFRYIDIVLNKQNHAELKGFRTIRNTNIELNIAQPYNQISKKYASNTKRNIKKAKSFGLSLTAELNSSDLIHLFRTNMGKDLKNIKSQHYRILQQIMNESLEKKQAEIYGIRSQNEELIAGAFFLQSFNNYIFLFSATNQESREKRAMFLIIDQFIKDHANNTNMLDFEGSNNNNLARFYKGFGSSEFHYLSIKKNKLPALLKIIKP